jgi:uncharacterized linocin/CFP29 family protein
MDLGRDRLTWSVDIWKLIDDAVHDEVMRTSVATKFLPLHGPSPAPEVMTVPSDIINPATMTVDEVAVTPIIELGVEFGLTRQQIGNEGQLATAVTLATRSANLLAQAEDMVLFQGDRAFDQELFKRLQKAGGGAGQGLLNGTDKVVTVTPISTGVYGERTFDAVARAYSMLQGNGHYGPYALALHTDIYADTFAALPGTLAVPADRIRPLVPLGFFGTGTVPPARGVMVSVGGNSMDLVSSVDPVTEFLQVDAAGTFRFKVFERFTLRVKDPTAIVRLEFNSNGGGK